MPIWPGFTLSSVCPKHRRSTSISSAVRQPLVCLFTLYSSRDNAAMARNATTYAVESAPLPASCSVARGAHADAQWMGPSCPTRWNVSVALSLISRGRCGCFARNCRDSGRDGNGRLSEHVEHATGERYVASTSSRNDHSSSTIRQWGLYNEYNGRSGGRRRRRGTSRHGCVARQGCSPLRRMEKGNLWT